MYRTDFWTLWEKARVGCFERTACILSIVKQITSPGWMHETSAQGWCTGRTQRDGMGREVGGRSGWGTHVNPWLIHVNVWQNPLQYCKVISLQLIKINEKKKKVEVYDSPYIKFVFAHLEKASFPVGGCTPRLCCLPNNAYAAL